MEINKRERSVIAKITFPCAQYPGVGCTVEIKPPTRDRAATVRFDSPLTLEELNGIIPALMAEIECLPAAWVEGEDKGGA